MVEVRFLILRQKTGITGSVHTVKLQVVQLHKACLADNSLISPNTSPSHNTKRRLHQSNLKLPTFDKERSHGNSYPVHSW